MHHGDAVQGGGKHDDKADSRENFDGSFKNKLCADEADRAREADAGETRQ